MQTMAGVRILEIAEHTFVPAASAILADWGADVIKVEHAERGDAMRGLARTGVVDLSKGVHVLLEHSNRGKRSIGIDITKPEGLEIVYAIARTADVFLTNKLPSVLDRLKIDEDRIRAQNPRIIYVRGSAFGPKGPDRDKGGYDATAFWCRGGSADASTPPGGAVANQPAPAYGDSIGGMTIAGGIAAALFRRERTGVAGSVDVSLLATGAWAMSAAIALSLQMERPWRSAAMATNGPGNPVVGIYEASDKRYLSFVMLQGFAYWPDFCEHIGRPELVSDPRFSSHEKLFANAADARQIIQQEIGSQPLKYWVEKFQTLKGQWTVVQDTLEVAADAQMRANGYLLTAQTREGTPFDLIASPVQFDGEPGETRRAPEFNEHGDEILGELGFDQDRILELKIAGAVT
jgi:crotonobetainyl-CoA:carnitine CoA-transferase CaiB-like acyl-CoA transferase